VTSLAQCSCDLGKYSRNARQIDIDWWIFSTYRYFSVRKTTLDCFRSAQNDGHPSEQTDRRKAVRWSAAPGGRARKRLANSCSGSEREGSLWCSGEPRPSTNQSRDTSRALQRFAALSSEIESPLRQRVSALSFTPRATASAVSLRHFRRSIASCILRPRTISLEKRRREFHVDLTGSL